jgi:hypothetical protein
VSPAVLSVRVIVHQFDPLMSGIRKLTLLYIVNDVKYTVFHDIVIPALFPMFTVYNIIESICKPLDSTAVTVHD